MKWLIPMFISFAVMTMAMLVFQILAQTGYVDSEYFNLMLVLVCPVLFIVQTWATNLYNFRGSLTLREIPLKGYEKARQTLDHNQSLVSHLGLRKFTEFYLPTTVDLVAYVYEHRELPTVFCDYYYSPQKRDCEFVTKFENGLTLTTTNLSNAGVTPRPTHNLLQCLPGLSPNSLFEYHAQAIGFLQFHGLQPFAPRSEVFQQYFLAQWRKYGEQARHPLYGGKYLFWTLLKRGEKYKKSIQEQCAAGTIVLPELKQLY